MSPELTDSGANREGPGDWRAGPPGPLAHSWIPESGRRQGLTQPEPGPLLPAGVRRRRPLPPPPFIRWVKIAAHRPWER